jgi:hypothetical protein
MSEGRERKKESECRKAEMFRHLMSGPRCMAAPARREALDLLLYPDGVELNPYTLAWPPASMNSG